MYKTLLGMVIVASLQSGIVHAMEDGNNDIVPTKSMTTKDFVITGILVGGCLEFVNIVAREGRYKHVLAFAKKHPGLSLAAFSATLGAGMLYGEPVKNYFTYKIEQYKK
jgi:hypothetical protein